jgi:prepilin-type N-terminal cleavage/methylation domain-containing protein
MIGLAAKAAKAQSRARGFSLVEALVVVMIILVIAAIAIPSMLQARIRANEGAAVASIHTIQTAQTLYFNAYPQVGYAARLADLGSHGSNCESPGKTNACIIMDDALAGGLKNGYMFEILTDGNTPAMSYTITATPESAGSTGRCTYSSTSSGGVQGISSANSGKFSLGGAGGCD